MFHDHLRAHWEEVDGDFVVALEARQFYDAMHRDHPDELAEWLEAKVIDFIAGEFRALLQRERAKSRRRAGARTFREFADQYAADGGPDNPDAADTFRQAYVVSHDNLWRRVAEMTGEDHRFVADQYEARGNRLLMLASFHRVIARKIGGRRTEEVFSEAEYADLMTTFTNGERLPDSVRPCPTPT